MTTRGGEQLIDVSVWGQELLGAAPNGPTEGGGGH